MGNLGLYQVLTTTARKVGGPINLLGITAGTGALLGVCGTVIYFKMKEERESSYYILTEGDEKSVVKRVNSKTGTN